MRAFSPWRSSLLPFGSSLRVTLVGVTAAVGEGGTIVGPLPGGDKIDSVDRSDSLPGWLWLELAAAGRLPDSSVLDGSTVTAAACLGSGRPAA
jgi:hypothetical protein